MNLILGTANFGNDYGKRLEKEECFRILDRAKELGVWAIDTAQSYGNSPNIIQEWNGGLKIFSKMNVNEEYPSYANYILAHNQKESHPLGRKLHGTSYYTTDIVSIYGFIQAQFNPIDFSFKDWANQERFIARSIFCGGKLQRGNNEDTARLVFGFLKSHDVKNCVFGVESIEELELNMRIANEK